MCGTLDDSSSNSFETCGACVLPRGHSTTVEVHPSLPGVVAVKADRPHVKLSKQFTNSALQAAFLQWTLGVHLLPALSLGVVAVKADRPDGNISKQFTQLELQAACLRLTLGVHLLPSFLDCLMFSSAPGRRKSWDLSGAVWRG